MQHGDAMRRTRRTAQVQELAQEAAHCWPGGGVVFESIQLREHRASDHQEHLAAEVGGAGFTWMSGRSVLPRRPSQERLPTTATYGYTYIDSVWCSSHPSIPGHTPAPAAAARGQTAPPWPALPTGPA